MSLTDSEAEDIKDLVYRSKIVVLKDQSLSAAFGRRLGEPEVYYEPTYHPGRARHARRG